MAVELPADVKAALAGLIELIRGARVNGVRTARPDGIHLTLKFLGDISSDRIEPISAAISAVTRTHSAFALTMGGSEGGPGAFPSRASARVLWMGVQGDLTNLSHLQQRIEDAFEALGFARDRRRFNPHLTVARIGDRTSKADRLKVSQTLFSAAPGPELPLDVASVCLMRSILMPDAAVYERLAEFPMAGSSTRQTLNCSNG